SKEFLATVINGTPQQHGVIRRLPDNLRDLHELIAAAGDNLLAILRERIRRWKEQGELLDRSLVLVLLLPKTRVVGGPTESIDARAFLCHRANRAMTILDIGEEVGLWVV